MAIMDNSAIARIAAPDLSSDTLALLEKYSANDDVIFFLGRLVWQGEMIECVPALIAIACDSKRGRYARIASIRGAMSVGDSEQKDRLWETIAGHPGPLDWEMLAELLEWAAPTTRSVELLLRTLARLAPFERFNTSRLNQALHTFVDRLPLMADEVEVQPLGNLIVGLNGFLGRTPFVELGECHVSKEFVWLMPSALHAVDRLVAARSKDAISPDAIAIMRNMPALRYWRDSGFSEYKSSLATNVPRWQELNDLLYWASITDCRDKLKKKGETLADDWRVAFVGHFWSFGPEDFDRCLDWVRTKEDKDDRLVALSRSIQILVEANRPAAWLKSLRAAIDGDKTLESMLEAHLYPKPSSALQAMEANNRKWKEEREAQQREEEASRADWVRELKQNPDRVRHPAGLKSGEFSGDQFHLLLSAMGKRSATDREDGANWQRLIPEFGEQVARAFRDAAVGHWRAYQPVLRSEGADTTSTPYSLVFAMTGLAIEAGEDTAFAHRLTAEEARHAFRYITYQLNGFPSWFEPLYHAHAGIGLEAVWKELLWELEHNVTAEPLHHILHDILYHAPWLHAEVAPLILGWLRGHDVQNADGLRYCLNIMTGGGTAQGILAELAAGKVQGPTPTEQRPRWFALWVDSEPPEAIPSLERVLEELPRFEAVAFAQQFVVGLLGDRHGAGGRVGAYRNAQDLKRLYVLMHRYITTSDDIERAGKGVYSPTLRDNAQDARNTLFNMLASITGAEAYAAIKALEKEHPDPKYRRAMALRARERATIDADEPPWTVGQVRAFAKDIADD